MPKPHLLVISTDADYVYRLREMILPQWYDMTYITHLTGFETTLEQIRHTDIALLDIESFRHDWQSFLTSLTSRFQQAYYLAVIEADEQQPFERLFAHLVVDYLEKDATASMIQKRVNNLLRLRTLASENQELSEALHQKSQKLAELEYAITTMKSYDKQMVKATKHRMLTQVHRLIMPLFENPEALVGNQTSRGTINALQRYVDDFASGLAAYLDTYETLSTQELRVALMVKNGMTSHEIAGHLHVSPETIKTHRRNIRRKFGLTSSSQKLNAYLQLLEPDIGEGHETSHAFQGAAQPASSHAMGAP